MSANLVIGIITILIVGSLFAGLLARKQSRNRAAGFMLGEPAIATIIEVGTSQIHNYGEPFSAALRLIIAPLSGESFKARSPWVIEFAHLADIRVGASLPVKIDRYKKNIIHPDVDWAKYDWHREHEPEPVYEDTHPIMMQ